MTTVYLSPVFGAGSQVLNNSGVPLGGGKIYVYVAGTTTPTNTYTTQEASVLNSNPIILDASGRPPSEVWLPAGIQYKFAITDSSGATVGYTMDNISGINDGTSALYPPGEWNQIGSPSYVSASSFSVAGNQTSIFQQFRRVQFICTGGTGYGTVSTATYGGGITTVTIVADTIGLDSGLTVLYYALINSYPKSLPSNVAMLGNGLSGTGNIMLGVGAGPVVTGNYNIGIGTSALQLTTTGVGNVAIGNTNLQSVVSGSYNVAVGNLTQNLTTGSNNVSVGAQAMEHNATGGSNVAIGSLALDYNVGGSNNVAVGANALLLYLGGSFNTALGYNSGAGAGTGSGAPYNAGTHNIYIGYNAFPLTTTDTNSIVIGDQVTSLGSNTIVLGNTSITDTYIMGGRFRVAQYSTAGAPAYVKGGMYFDTTLNKLRIGGASAWETVTSV